MRFEEVVEKIEKDYADSSIDIRIEKINQACEEYILKYGKKPDSLLLVRLANLVLRDDIKNPDSYKIQREQYPFHSEPQAKRRRKHEFVAMSETLDFMNYKKKTNLSTAPPKEKHLKI